MIDYEKFWSAVPDKALHPHRVPILEALRSIGEPLSAIALVNVLDGHVTMWEAAHHLQALEALDVVEPVPADTGRGASGNGDFDALYRLKNSDLGGGA